MFKLHCHYIETRYFICCKYACSILKQPTGTSLEGSKAYYEISQKHDDVSLYFHGKLSNELIGFCDSDYAGELKERRSTSGYVFLLHGGPIAWSSKLQRITALSSSEAEYMTISEALKEILWLRSLVESFGLKQMKPTKLRVDNQAAIAMSKNPVP